MGELSQSPNVFDICLSVNAEWFLVNHSLSYMHLLLFVTGNFIYYVLYIHTLSTIITVHIKRKIKHIIFLSLAVMVKVHLRWFIMFIGESSMEIKTEADTNIVAFPPDDKPSSGLFWFYWCSMWCFCWYVFCCWFFCVWLQSLFQFDLTFSPCVRFIILVFEAPCGLQGSKYRPAPFPGQISYKATKPGC